ncbi:tetratricopeptide repeat protein [Pseudodesulfovibrio sp. S3]|uniref:tetratricopeptide repeat protein n=1 Tax=unclassified Pseudodesulfovibrio TaxID=2661612 RepID=UPI000FEBC32D|nr:tetratricopeptide repeat protein [Pseudodesulfovibrio sp. S3]MCJ2165711.1 tetratricopeptide repeat protein [Pseudodesulfovibrio sp. S3-i]RWU02972.1 tetratricopeptide repeat protein [Pseudodesulfovibrio sp. S3]
MTDQSEQRSPESILAAVKEVEREALGGAEALFMASMLAESSLPYDFALSMDGTPHNPALINPAAAFFAATAIIDPLVERDLIDVDADNQVFALRTDARDALRASFDEEQSREWACRAIYGLNLILPDAEPQNWPVVNWLMPHVLACRDLVAELGVNTAAANRVMHQAGFSLYFQQRHTEAIALLEAAMATDVAVKGGQHPDIVNDLEGLATVHWAAGDLARAEAAFAACFELQQEIFTENNPVMGSILNSLAMVRQSMGRLDQAEQTFRQCLAILETVQDGEHPATASCLNNLALLLEALNRPKEALDMAARSLSINTDLFGEAHPETASSHNVVALLHDRLGNRPVAEAHFRKSLGIREQIFGSEHPETAQALCNLALFLESSGRDEEAFKTFEQGFSVYEAALGPDHPLMDSALENMLALLERIAASDSDLRGRAEERLKTIVQKAG